MSSQGNSCNSYHHHMQLKTRVKKNTVTAAQSLTLYIGSVVLRTSHLSAFLMSLLIRAEWPTASLPDSLLTSQEADPPEARVQRGLDVHALVQRHDDALLQVQPVVGADCQSQQPQAADCKDTAQQCQGLPAARAHFHSEGEGTRGVGRGPLAVDG